MSSVRQSSFSHIKNDDAMRTKSSKAERTIFLLICNTTIR